MSSNVQVHVVNKTDSLEHHTLSSDSSLLPPLAANNVRLQVKLCSLTANNLTYARHAAIANWWDAFQVPGFLPSPYNDTSKYGIVPVWGYAEIISSRNAGLETGTIIYGFWPSSTLPVDLQLEPTEPAGHYIDTTPHRQSLWTYYRRYTLAPQPLNLTSPTLAAKTVFKPLFECSHSLNAYVLGPLAIHPAHTSPTSTPWPSHADLSSTAVISLSASGKTARAFNDAVLNTRPLESTNPQAFLAITSNPPALTLPTPAQSTIITKVLSYASALRPDLTTFLTTLSPLCAKIIIADFGARDDSLAPLIANLRSALPPSTALTVIGIGAEPTATAFSLEAALAQMAAVPERVQMNTSLVREAAIAAVGAEAYFGGLEEGWKGFCGS